MTQNLTRVNTHNQKRGLSVAFFHLDYTDIIADSGEGSIMFVMPKHSIIIHIGVIEETAANVGANVDILIGVDTIVTDGPIDANGLYTLIPIHSDLEGDFIIKQGSVPPTSGYFEFFTVYCEHTKKTGEYTNYSDN